MEDSIPDNTEENFPGYSILGVELTTFILQAGFVEGIIADSKEFPNLTKAYQHIFRNNKEYTILLWNGIPIRLSYTEDIPYLVEELIEFLEAIQNNSENASFRVATKNNQWQLDATIEHDDLTVKSNFSHLSGNYQHAFEPLSLLKMETSKFLSEWKILLEQLVTALERSGCKLTSQKGEQSLERLRSLNNRIHKTGVLYT